MHASPSVSTTTAVVSDAMPGNPGVTSSSALSGSLIGVSAPQLAVPAKPPDHASLVPVSPAAVCTLVTKVNHPGPKMTAPQQGAPLKAAPAAIQLPANFQIPPGTVLIKSSNGQLMLVSQQALARAQAQVQNSSARPPISSSGPTIQICSLQNSRNQLVSNLASGSEKTVPLSAALAPVTQTVTFQRSPNVMQSTGAQSGIVKVSSSVPSKANTSVPGPTLVRICTTPQSVANNQGASAVIIRASTPSAVTVSSTSPAATTTTPSAMGIKGSSALALNSSTVTVLPVRTSISPLTPIAVNTCSSVVMPTTTVCPSQVPASPANSAIPIPAKQVTANLVKTYIPSSGPPAVTSSTVKITGSNSCSATTPVGTSIIVSSISPATTLVTSSMKENNRPIQIQASVQSVATNTNLCKAEPPNKPQNTQPSNTTEVLDNVKKCKNFLATLIKLASSGPQSPTMGQNVKNLVKNLLDSKLEPEEFTTKLYKELKSSPQPYLVPFLKKSLPSLRRLMPSSQEFILQCGQQTPPPQTAAANSLSFVKITPSSSMQTVKPVGFTPLGTVKVPQTTPAVPPSLSTFKPVNIKQMVVQQTSSGIVKQVTTMPSNSALNINRPGEKHISLNSLLQTGHMPQASVVKQITVPRNKVISLQASTLPIKENSSACFREEDDINDVTSMAGVNLNEENACILATNSELVGAVIRSCKDEPFLFTSALQTRILDIGKRHDIKELNSDVMNLVSHATQERLRDLIEKLTVAAQHRSTNCRQYDRYVQCSDVRAQLKFLEQLEHLEKQRKTEEEREMLLRAAKSRANKEDPEQLRLKQKAKEMQQLELEQMQYREANLTALAAIGPRRKRPLETSLQNGLCTSGSSVFSIPKSIFVPRITRVSLRDLIFCMEQERTTKHSLSLYRALLK
ncbi:transcription initiation factor TFIID subunit 4B isoform X2 [Hyla sarda]|uniref:transcription initiation factor TFIID subunit 4B isoform X2 n=1 Tax=Hyla sarda TaxID=327740 RepID=UPI0024C3F5C2|nr:transcription initiation factor TFIID subunit 4B isoform X2 [Hyla sarda]